MPGPLERTYTPTLLTLSLQGPTPALEGLEEREWVGFGPGPPRLRESNFPRPSFGPFSHLLTLCPSLLKVDPMGLQRDTETTDGRVIHLKPLVTV